jgi:hypothetical protein
MSRHHWGRRWRSVTRVFKLNKPGGQGEVSKALVWLSFRSRSHGRGAFTLRLDPLS